MEVIRYVCVRMERICDTDLLTFKVSGEIEMKCRIVVLAALLLLAPVIIFAETVLPWEQKLPFENLTVNYEIAGMEEGKETVYVKDYGERVATYRTSVTSMLGMKSENDSVIIEDPDWIYSFNLTEKTGIKSANPLKYMKEEYEKLSEGDKQQIRKNSEKFGGDITDGLGGEIEQKVEKMFGFDCDRVSMMGTTSYTIHNTPILLKLEANVMGITMSQVATSVEKGEIDESRFAFPEGITPVYDGQADEMARKMAKNSINWLKDPEAKMQDAVKMGMPQQSGGGDYQPSQEEQELMQQAEEAMKGLKDLFGQ